VPRLRLFFTLSFAAPSPPPRMIPICSSDKCRCYKYLKSNFVSNAATYLDIELSAPVLFARSLICIICPATLMNKHRPDQYTHTHGAWAEFWRT
jgi:hypothetical protein